MNTFDCLFNRKSVKSYNGEKISDELLDKIILAANASPVGMGRYDNMHLTVIQNKDMINLIDAEAAKFFGNPSSHPLYGAPTLVLVSTKIEKANVSYSNAAIMVHNMAIAATDLNVGSCYIWGAVAALNENPKLIEKLNLPEGFTPCCGIILGKFDGKYEERNIQSTRVTSNYIL
ncbi:MAG: nitroreductase family protein [Clostridiaceae bacterium]|nr:nitroreductase family protein [Clostridiaceae bacterium]